jgi:hypothetical protein
MQGGESLGLQHIRNEYRGARFIFSLLTLVSVCLSPSLSFLCFWFYFVSFLEELIKKIT